jgi:hypothetical protein
MLARVQARHEFDKLTECYAIDASPATTTELPIVEAIAKNEIPSISAGRNVLERIHEWNPESVFPFRSKGKILGGVAFLYLNNLGFEALILGEFDFACPDLKLLARPSEKPAALYIWALAARGRAVAGMGNVSRRMHQKPFSGADYFAQPTTRDGLRFTQEIGFEPFPSGQPDLWTYRRICNRAASSSPIAA